MGTSASADLEGLTADFARTFSTSAAYGHVACNFALFSAFSRLFASCFVQASLDPLIAAGGVLTLLRAIMASATPFYNCRRALAHILKRYPWYFTCFCNWNRSPFDSLGGHHLGSVDCWLCQIFTRSLGTTLSSFRVLRVTRRGFSPPESYMQRTC